MMNEVIRQIERRTASVRIHGEKYVTHMALVLEHVRRQAVEWYCWDRETP